MDRRQFLNQAVSLAAATGVVTSGQVAKAVASERVRVGVVGAGGRALSLNRTFAANPNVEVVRIADVDAERIPKAVQEVRNLQGTAPQTTGDFRHLIDDDSIDAIVVGTPDHWHALPTILACLVGKDVYVEKPDSHNIIEGMRIVEAMRKNGRIVQMGSQHRSTTRLQSALEYIRSGALGQCLVAKGWESSKQSPLRFLPDSAPPRGVDYDMWLGSAPKRPFNPNRFHGDWKWFYDYGTGDLGNDGVHRIDMAIAALNAACEAQGHEPCVLPRTITATGGKRYFDDMQEFPDTLQVTYEFAGRVPKILTYEMRVWSPYQYLGESEGSAVFGDKGYIIIGNERWRAYNSDGLVKQARGGSHEAPHVQDFIDCVRSRNTPNCDVETIGHPASVICHAGNISARLGRQLTLEASDETFVDDAEANTLRGRPEWRRPWTLPQV